MEGHISLGRTKRGEHRLLKACVLDTKEQSVRVFWADENV